MRVLISGNLGNALANLGDFTTAEMYHREQLDIATDIKDKSARVRANCNLGRDYLNILGCFAKGIACDQKAREIAIEEPRDRSGEMLVNRNLGIAYQSVADFENAKKHHSNHLIITQELSDRVEEGRAYTNLGNVYRSFHDFGRAKVFHDKSLSIAIEVNDKDGEGRPLYSLGLDFESVGSLHEALHYHQSCVKLYNKMRADLHGDRWKILFRDQHKDAYAALWETLVKIQMTDEALYEAEKARAQHLNDLLNLRFGHKVPGRHEEICHIVRNIPTKTVFLALGSNKINFWVFCRGDQIHFRQKEIDVAAAIQHLNKNAYIAIEADDPDVQNKVTALSNLYDTVIGPIEDLLKGDQELIIIPDGPLYFVPYAALLNHEDPAHFLGEYVRIRIFPSLANLKIIVDGEDQLQHSKGKPEALLVGNPTNPKPLPNAETEVNEIAKIIDPLVHDQVLINQEATKEAVLKRIYSAALVHIAAHGQIDTGEIVLAQI